MRPFFQHPVVRRCRILFRWCRIFLWLVVFLAVAAVAYLHLIGLPDFLKRPLLQRLLAEGVAAEFSNMQLGWGRGPSIIIENPSFSRSHQPLSPRLSASRAELALSWDALLHSQIEARSLQVSDAQLQLPFSETNGDALLLNNMALEMQFYLNDVVQLDYCRVTFRGIQMDFIGRVSHFSALRHWKFPMGGGDTNGAFQARLRQVAQAMQQIHLIGTPLLQIEAGADGRDMNSLHVEMNFDAPAIHTPWGNVTNLIMNAACARLVDPGNQPFLQLEGSASSLATPWAASRQISFLTAFSRGTDSNLDAEIQLNAVRFNAASDAGSNGFAAASLSWKGSATLASSNFIPLLAAGNLRATEPQTPWGSAQEMSLQCRAARALDLPPPGADWGPWIMIAPWILDCQAETLHITTPKILCDHLAFAGHWRAPQLVIENLQGELYGGQMNAGAILDVASRELRCDGMTDFNPHSITQLLKPAASNWMEQLDWTTPPKVNAQLRVLLPPWTNRPADWGDDMGSTLQLAGDFSVGPSSFRLAPVQSAQAHVTYTNRAWNVSHLHAIRPDGDIDMDYTSGPQDYHYVIDSRLDPKAALPLLPPGRQHILDELAFRQPPEIHAEIWGCWHDPKCLGFTASIAATNFIARGETVAAFSAGLDYTNLILSVTNLSLSNEQCQVRAPWLQADFGTKMVTVTNVAGSANPPILQRVLGEYSPAWLNDIRFDTTPSVSVSGSFSLTNQMAMNLHFLVSGQRLHYARLLADRAVGGVDWIGRTVTLTNIVAGLYNNGTAMGWIVFDGKPNHSSDFHMDFTVRDIDLADMVTGLTGKTNQLEGRLDGDLALDGPNDSNGKTWQGAGRIHAHDALLWDIKIFGLLSPVLNVISPGWGHSRAHDAVADFVITNGILSSDDLEVQCQGFHMDLHGTVDKNRQINARLEAILSRQVPIFGPLLSLAFTPLSKMFEYHVSGPVDDPVLEPVYVPRFIMFLLHPFKPAKTPSSSEAPPASTSPATRSTR